MGTLSHLDDLATDARRMWHALEPLHASIYFAPEAAQAFKDLGLKGFWMGYFASRASAMGPVPPGVVTATFFNFHPRMVERAIPDAWAFAPAEAVLAARIEAATTVLRRLVGAEAAAVAEAAGLVRAACEGLDCAGRPLAAAWAGVPWPDDPLGDLWLGATVLREHRGDGHVGTLVAEGLTGCQAHALAAAGGLAPREVLQPNRGWTDEEWAGAEQALRERGWLDDGARLTPEGRAARQRIEESTDRLALAPLRALGPDRTARLLALGEALAERARAAEAVPFPNPMGLPRP